MPTALNTPVIVPPMDLRIVHGSGVVALGSCFADEIGQRMLRDGFRVELNPFGTLYNPASVAAALDRLVDDREVVDADLVSHEGLWHSWCHHGSFSRQSADECLAACNSRIHSAHTALKEASVLMVTFGTAWVFYHEGRVVANCHKVPSAHFRRMRLGVEEIADAWKKYPQQYNTIFTVSPIRHLADGAHGNQLSKSTLLLAVDQLMQECRQADYFGSYELMLDELRDYRFYARDLCHPSDVAVDIIWQRFQQRYMTDATRCQAALNEKARRQTLHRPLHPPADTPPASTDN